MDRSGKKDRMSAQESKGFLSGWRRLKRVGGGGETDVTILSQPPSQSSAMIASDTSEEANRPSNVETGEDNDDPDWE